MRSRETHPGPHSAWFWDKEQAGGGAIVDLGCHCIEIIRNFIGKDNRPVEVMCWADTLVHPIEAEDYAIGLIRFENGAIGQFEVSWTFRGGMDLRDEVAGTEGTIWLNHFLRTGFEMFTAAGQGGYVAEKAETETRLAVPGGRRGARARLRGHVHRHVRRHGRGRAADGDVLRRVRRQRRHGRVLPLGRIRQWEPVDVEWRGGTTPESGGPTQEDGLAVIKEEHLPDGRRKLILRDPGRRHHRPDRLRCAALPPPERATSAFRAELSSGFRNPSPARSLDEGAVPG